MPMICPECDGEGTIEICWNGDPDRCETIQCETCLGTGVAEEDADDL